MCRHGGVRRLKIAPLPPGGGGCLKPEARRHEGVARPSRKCLRQEQGEGKRAAFSPPPPDPVPAPPRPAPPPPPRHPRLPRLPPCAHPRTVARSQTPTACYGHPLQSLRPRPRPRPHARAPRQLLLTPLSTFPRQRGRGAPSAFFTDTWSDTPPPHLSFSHSPPHPTHPTPPHPTPPPAPSSRPSHLLRAV